MSDPYADKVRELSREERIALLAFRQGHLLATVYLNLGKDTMPLYNLMQDTLKAMENTDAVFINETANRIDGVSP